MPKSEPLFLFAIFNDAGKLYGETKPNENFELTPAEIHLNNYYNALYIKDPNADKESSKFKL